MWIDHGPSSVEITAAKENGYVFDIVNTFLGLGWEVLLTFKVGCGYRPRSQKSL